MYAYLAKGDTVDDSTTNDRSTTTAGSVVTDVGPWAMIPEWVLVSDLSPVAVRLYGLLALHADRKTSECFPGRERLSRLLGASSSTVKRAMADLVDLGAVTIAPRFDDDGRQRSNVYRLRLVDPRGSVGEPLGGVTGEPGEGVMGEPQNQNQREPEPEGPENPLPSSAKADEVEADKARGFDLFWEAYPRRNGKRVGKANALRKWKALSVDHKREAYRAVQNYARAVASGATIARDAERFLANRWWAEWLDDPGTPDPRRAARGSAGQVKSAAQEYLDRKGAR